MTTYSRAAFGLAVALCGLLAATGSAQAIFIKGNSGPAGEVCKSAGGTMNGKMCELPNGESCEGMTLALHNKCVDAEGNEIDQGPDFGSNLPPEESESSSE